MQGKGGGIGGGARHECCRQRWGWGKEDGMRHRLERGREKGRDILKLFVILIIIISILKVHDNTFLLLPFVNHS